jgi:translation initiation factor 2B subunit (eIF-2B alpha/beta/delta family)
MKAFSAGLRIEQQLDRIAHDRRSGANGLAERAAQVLAGARPARAVDVKAYVRAVEVLARRVEGLRPAMVPVGNVSRHIGAHFAARASTFASAAEAYAALNDIASATRARLRDIPDQVASAVCKRFPAIARPLVISYSSQVVVTVSALRRRPLHVTVCESRPALEGRRTAALLRGHARVTMITEAQAGRAVGTCDSVMLGCDAIDASGSIVNKSGSYLLALAGQRARKPVIVVGNSFKLRASALPASRGQTRSLYNDEGERHPASQVWRNPPHGIRIENVAFETVPAECLDYIVLETGVYRPALMKKIVGRQSAVGDKGWK